MNKLLYRNCTVLILISLQKLEQRDKIYFTRCCINWHTHPNIYKLLKSTNKWAIYVIFRIQCSSLFYNYILHNLNIQEFWKFSFYTHVLGIFSKTEQFLTGRFCVSHQLNITLGGVFIFSSKCSKYSLRPSYYTYR